jgi:site-specific recombinase XerD
MPDRPDDPGDLPIAAAIERYLNRRRADATESSVYSWAYRLKLFREWCEERELAVVGDLDPWTLDEWYDHRAATVAPSTLEGEMWTLKPFIEYCEQLQAVAADLSDAVRIPDLDDADRSDDTKLAEHSALALRDYYRSDEDAYGSRAHAFFELAWHTGARIGGLRALDLRDAHLDERYVEFFHRPETGTPLKNKANGERAVALPPETVAALRTFVREHRIDVHDEYGRQPLLASQAGRPGPNTIRVWSYLATEPCLHSPCPHGKARETCEYTKYAHASKCPSSRSPHQIRTGSVTWQRNIGIPPEIVAQRVNASLDVIEAHYDKETRRQRMERRRRRYVSLMESDHDDL